MSALVIASVLGLVVGVWCASKPNSAPDRILTAASRLAVSVPEFISGPLLVLVFAVTLHALPATGWGTLDQAVLPVMTVALLPTAVFVQVTRAEASKVSAQQWVSTIRASGLSEGRVLRQVLRNSMTPVIGLMSLFLPGLIGGAVIVEVIFSIPGRGRLLYTAVLDSDLPLAQAGLMVLLALAVISTIASDLARRVIDPRLRR
ncbi:ABC transporter permease [Rhodococcoides kyotonense]|uniref:ABC transporter permease n=1 Tax=Rhodococcoides kyotonense TaxID=398843 RepID=UPI0015959493|nr:ABC transporter permease [Rhodococcus kyotonensis]